MLCKYVITNNNITCYNNTKNILIFIKSIPSDALNKGKKCAMAHYCVGALMCHDTLFVTRFAKKERAGWRGVIHAHKEYRALIVREHSRFFVTLTYD